MELRESKINKKVCRFKKGSSKKGSYRPVSRKRIAKKNISILKNNMYLYNIEQRLLKG